MSVSNVLEHYLEARRNARVLNVPIAEVRDEIGEDGFTYFFRDSVLFRRKQQQELELGIRPTESASLAAGDEAAERRLWAKVLDTEDSEEQVLVLESHSVLATSIWVIVDYGINIPLYQGNVISQQKYVTPVMWMLLTLGYMAYLSRKAMLDGSLDRKFGGWFVNACMGVRGTLDPARTIRHLPTIVFMSWIILRIAVFAAIPFNDPGITYCSATIEDDCKRPWISVLVGQASIIFYAAAIMLLIAFRLDLCPGAHEALLQEAKAVIEVYPPIEDVLIAAEMKVQASDGPSTRSWFHRLVCLACFAYALFTSIVVLVVENEDFKLGEAAVFVTVLSSVAIGLSCYALVFITYGLSATYNACVVRMQMLSTFLHDHAIENIRLLQAWWKLRVFYLRIVTPICYDSVQASAAALGIACIFFLAVLCVNTINPPDVEYDDRMKVNGFGFLVVLTLLTAPSSVIMLQKANSVIAEQIHHIELLSRKCMSVRAAALGLREEASRIHKAKDSLRKLRAGEQGSEEAGQREEIELLVSDMIEHIQKFDPKPTFLGIELGPTTLKVLYGYITTAVGFVIVVILHEANVEVPPFT